MDITIKGEPKEIAALVVEIQERHDSTINITLDGTVIAQRIAN